MKIIATSDIHIPKYQAKMPALIRQLVGSNADVMIIAGDIANINDSAMEDFFGEISMFPGPKLYVPGNHDLWVGEGNKGSDSKERYNVILPEICRKYDIHMLDQEPFIYKNIGFAGNIGWYDYSFARVYAPAPGTKFLRYKDSKKLSIPEEIKWSDLTIDDWRKKEVYYKAFMGMIQSTGCNDRDYIKDFWDDKDFCEMMQAKLDEHLTKIENKVEKIVAVFHCVPFKESLARNNAKPNVCFMNAFIGSKYLGDVIYKHPKVALTLWGHVHHRQSLSKGAIKCINISYDTSSSNPVNIEI